MAEIGLLASVLQVAGAGLKLSQTLYQYADSVASADRRVKDIATEVELTSRIIEELGTLFELQETSQLLSQNALNTANKTVRECSSVFTELEAALKKTKKNTLGRLMLPFRESKIELLRRHIDTLKSTLQLLLQVLVHAHQVAAQKLSRQAEAEQREQIKALLQTKKESVKKYEESLRNHSMSDDSTILGDGEQEDVEGPDETTKHNVLVTAALIGSSITVSKLEKCVLHIQGLLSDIEALQTALSKESDEAKHSDHHQKAMGSYLQAREHLDSIFLGNPQDSKTAASASEENHERIETGTGTSARLDQRATTTRYYIPPPPPMSSVPSHNSMNLPPPPPRHTNQKTLNVISGSSASRQYQYTPGAYQGYRGSTLPPPPAPPMLPPWRPVSPKILRPSSRSETRADIDSKTEMKHEAGALGEKGLIGRFDAPQTSNTETDTTPRRRDDGLLPLSPPSRYVADGLYWGPPPPPPLAPVIIPQNTNPIPTSISSPMDNPMPSTNWSKAYPAGIRSSKLPLEAHEERHKEEKREQLRLEAVKKGLRDHRITNRVPGELQTKSEREAKGREKEELEKKMQEANPAKKVWYTGGRSSQSEMSATQAAAMATAAAAGPAGYYEPPDHREEGRMQDPTSSAAGKASSTERQSRYSFSKRRTQDDEDDDDDEPLLFQMSESGADRISLENSDAKEERKEKEQDKGDDPPLKEMMEGLAGEDSSGKSEEEPKAVTKDALEREPRTKGLTEEHNASRQDAEDRTKEELKKKLQEEAAQNIQQEAKAAALGRQLPIVFQDAVGRKYNFPFHVCNTWNAMDILIKQAFAGVGPLSKYVDEGEYDLVNEHGDIILPTLWDSTIQPGSRIAMHMRQTRQPYTVTDTGNLDPSSRAYTSVSWSKYKTTSPANSVRLDRVKGQSADPQLRERDEHEEQLDAFGNKIVKSAKKAKLTSSELRKKKKDRMARRKRREDHEDSSSQSSQPSQPSNISGPPGLIRWYSAGSAHSAYRGDPKHPLHGTIQDPLQHPISMVESHDERTWYTQELSDPTASSVSSYTSRSAIPTSNSNNPWLYSMTPSVPSGPDHMSRSTTPASTDLKSPPPMLRLAIPQIPHSRRLAPYEGRSKPKGLPPLQNGTSLSAGGSSDASAHSRSISFGEAQAKVSASSYQAALALNAQSLIGSTDASADSMDEAAHRPGLGPSIKKTIGQKDAANAFRKAAAAAGAFRPRAGGAAAKLLAKDTKTSDEPDGISGVFVPSRQDLTPPRSEGLLSSHLQVSEQQHKQEGTTAYDGVMPVPVESLQHKSLPWADPFNQRSSHYGLDSSSGYNLPVPGDYANMLAYTSYGANRTRTSSNLSFIEPWSYPLHSPTLATSALADVRTAVGPSALSTGAGTPTSSAAAGFNDNAHKSQLNSTANPFQPSGSSESTLDQVSRSNRERKPRKNITESILNERGALRCEFPGCGKPFFRLDLLHRHQERHNEGGHPLDSQSQSGRVKMRKREEGISRSKADVLEQKVTSTEADSFDSDVTFIYESNPPEQRPHRSKQHHSRTPSTTSIVSLTDSSIIRNENRSSNKKASMKFANPHGAGGADADRGEETLRVGSGRIGEGKHADVENEIKVRAKMPIPKNLHSPDHLQEPAYVSGRSKRKMPARRVRETGSIAGGYKWHPLYGLRRVPHPPAVDKIAATKEASDTLPTRSAKVVVEAPESQGSQSYHDQSRYLAPCPPGREDDEDQSDLEVDELLKEWTTIMG